MTVLGPASYGLGFMAGVVSILSPCVLPIAPIVVGSALAAHRWGPIVLALGLTVSFTAVGLFIATAGFAIGLDAEWFKTVAASLLVVFGLVLLIIRRCNAGSPAPRRGSVPWGTNGCSACASMACEASWSSACCSA